jgi:uncharacterized protein
MNTDITVRNNTESGSYDAMLGERVVGMIVYERRGSRMIFRYTIVEPEFRRHGVGTTLVRAALDDLLANGMALTNYCGFTADFITGNPSYAGLLDADQPGRPLHYDAEQNAREPAEKSYDSRTPR